MKYEDVVNAVGGCGRYQICMLNVLYIATVFDGLQIGSMVFIAARMKHRCAIPGLTNDTYEVQSDAHNELIKEYIPEEIVDGKPVYSSCHLYLNKRVLGNQTLSNCTSWVYDKSIFQTTLTSDFNLVCGKKWLANQIYTTYFVGSLIATLFGSWLPDRFGRKTIIVAALLLQGTTGILYSQIMDINWILIFRTLTAIGCSLSFNPSVVFGAEISSKKNRTKATIIIQLYFTAGYFILSLLTYYIRKWTLIVLLISIPSVAAGLLYIWVLPESPRWLLTVKKKKEAEVIFNKIAKVNKRNLRYKLEEIEISVVEDRTVRLWKILTIPVLRKRSLILMFNWLMVSFVYFGLLINTENMSGNIFLNFFFGALVEVPAFLSCIFLLDRYGRKKMYIAFILTGGICGIITIVPLMYASEDLKWPLTVLASLSRLCLTSNFGIIYLHTCELYPTCARHGALGFLTTFSTLGGGILAPNIMYLRTLAAGRLGDSLPLLTMGFACIFAGVSYFFLPETNNKQIEDNFDDVINVVMREKDESQSETENSLNPAKLTSEIGNGDNFA